jgi:N-acyl-L-homoserine lactone synthetase
LLPEDKAHIIHSAFSQIFDGAPVTDVTKLELYRFAISVLESPKDKAFSPPPF